jgi:hypothetical protein
VSVTKKYPLRRRVTVAFPSRQCAICKRRTGALTGMQHALKNIGIKGNYAHHRCYSNIVNSVGKGKLCGH